mgnify:CR=1 FL=1
MNIFYLHEDPYHCATMHCDKHVVKMVLESAQMLSTAHRILDGDEFADRNSLYKAAHVKHPSSIWVRQSAKNYQWLVDLWNGLGREYSLRYGGKVHKSATLSGLKTMPVNIPQDAEFSPPPQCMPDEYKQEDTVQAYHDYYCAEKASFARWHGQSSVPPWFITKIVNPKPEKIVNPKVKLLWKVRSSECR